MQRTRGHHIARRMAALAVLALALVAFLGVVAQPAAAIEAWDGHGGASCTKCHSAGRSDAACTQSGCHNNATTPFVSRQTAGTATRNCWTCHQPGQDMSGVQTDPGCSTGAAGAACHGTATPHMGSNLKGCTTCHGTVQSISNPDGSAHHNNTAYSAPTCTDCHKTGGPAVAPHPAYTGETCSTCHVGMTSTHPAAAALISPTLTATANPTAITVAGGTTVVSGTLMNGATAVPGATLVLQKAATGTTTFTQAGATVVSGAGGAYAFAAIAPSGNTTYRVIAHGVVVGNTTYRPAKSATMDVTAPASSIKPVVTIALSGTSVRVTRKITIKGTLTPVKSGTVKIVVKRRTASGSFKTFTTKTVTLVAGATSSTYAWGYKTTKKGVYKTQTVSAASTGYLKAVSVWKKFTVK